MFCVHIDNAWACVLIDKPWMFEEWKLNSGPDINQRKFIIGRAPAQR